MTDFISIFGTTFTLSQKNIQRTRQLALLSTPWSEKWINQEQMKKQHVCDLSQLLTQRIPQQHQQPPIANTLQTSWVCFMIAHWRIQSSSSFSNTFYLPPSSVLCLSAAAVWKKRNCAAWLGKPCYHMATDECSPSLWPTYLVQPHIKRPDCFV